MPARDDLGRPARYHLKQPLKTTLKIITVDQEEKLIETVQGEVVDLSFGGCKVVAHNIAPEILKQLELNHYQLRMLIELPHSKVELRAKVRWTQSDPDSLRVAMGINYLTVDWAVVDAMMATINPDGIKKSGPWFRRILKLLVVVGLIAGLIYQARQKSQLVSENEAQRVEYQNTLHEIETCQRNALQVEDKLSDSQKQVAELKKSDGALQTFSVSENPITSGMKKSNVGHQVLLDDKLGLATPAAQVTLVTYWDHTLRIQLRLGTFGRLKGPILLDVRAQRGAADAAPAITDVPACVVEHVSFNKDSDFATLTCKFSMNPTDTVWIRLSQQPAPKIKSDSLKVDAILPAK